MDEDLSVLGLGTWAFCSQWRHYDPVESIRVVHEALDNGINFMDTAPIYGKGESELLLGKALKGREKVFVASKCGLQWNPKGKIRHDLSPEALEKELDEILKRLQRDSLDLLQIHWPNPAYPLNDTMEALSRFREKGKIRNIGLSNFSASQLKEALSFAPVATYQGLFNLLEQNAGEFHRNPLDYRSREDIFPLMKPAGMGFLPYSPLMQGVLTGAFHSKDDYEKDVRWSNDRIIGQALSDLQRLISSLKEIARDWGGSLTQMVLAWTMAQDEILSVIAGSRTTVQLRENLQSADKELGREFQERIEAVASLYESG